ncbi:serine/threonine-protein kinase Nek10-like isoform X1 [Lytechinus variegatus]|uniref:serine/threonine-protein kinase Nek10-like isoform X1 n=1 Tax=Lytechinus variegatus TaxID=7654 RepID=UPI001BB15B92|nr:serine/threonine-protein kinase Nek10-like isoform X1 [Lytechinus variegatus]XP_041478408.1 serine/threonine-protein kinase Nek10-like isoform X1 [Lytechinus variegatus]
MPSGDKKHRHTEVKRDKELDKLLRLLSTPTNKQQLPPLDFDASNNNNNNNSPDGKLLGSTSMVPHSPPNGNNQQHQISEASALENFSSKYQTERNFSGHVFSKQFDQIFSAIVKHRLCCSEWVERIPTEHIVRVLIVLRLFLRDQSYQKTLFELGGVKVLSQKLLTATENYLNRGDSEPFMVDILKEMSNIFQKLSGDVKQRDWLIACGAHRPLVMLLSASDVMVLHCSLYALIGMAQSPDPRAVIGELYCVETLLRILQDYDILSKKLAASLLKVLCLEEQVREQVKIFDGMPILLSILHSDNISLLWNVVWCIVQLSQDQDASNDVRSMGGIPLLLALLHDREFSSDRGSSQALASASSSGRHHSLPFPLHDNGDIQLEHILSLKSACCAALTELVHNDTNAQQIVQNNGIYSVGMLIFPQKTSKKAESEAVQTLQRNSFRTLRFLFSMERNRRLFKRLFPPDLFEKFIDVGHYQRDISAYNNLVEALSSLPADLLDTIKVNFEETNQNKEPTQSISGYLVYEHLGTGAFGSVYKVKKNAGGNFLALKEISYNNPAVGRTAKEKEKSIESIISELSIVKEHMRHPNVVRYYRTFTEPQAEKMYIVMELIEGAPLYEHFNSLKEKNELFSEERIWHIFIQIVLALRYLHKEKKIVHRDLTPNNIMLGERDRVTITDFGLARARQPDASKMTSVVGTILYSCPEIVQSTPYGEKADVWAAGCILYQMCTLTPPFYSSNMLALASKIVEADYEPLPADQYSDLVSTTIRRCLTADPEQRPDIVGVAGLIADMIMRHMDGLRTTQISLEKKLERERKRTQRHYHEATRNMQNYHRLFLASQEKIDRLANLSGSGGAVSIKSDSEINDVFESCDELSSTAGSQIDLGPIRPKHISVDTDKSAESGIEEDDPTTCDSLDSSSGSSILGSSLNSTTSHHAVPRPPNSPRPSVPIIIKRPFTAESPATKGLLSPSEVPSGSLTHRPSGATLHRAYSGSSLETLKRQTSSANQRMRPPSAAATLTISPRKVRQISDPVLKILHLIHKLIFICQLPPTLAPNPRRKVIERFKRALFSPQSNSVNLKGELKKVILGSKELIDLNLGVGEAALLLRQANQEEACYQVTGEAPAHVNLPVDPHDSDIGITYEQMQNFIESVLAECGYYSMSPHARRKLPLGPIGGAPLMIQRMASFDI